MERIRLDETVEVKQEELELLAPEKALEREGR